MSEPVAKQARFPLRQAQAGVFSKLYIMEPGERNFVCCMSFVYMFILNHFEVLS